MNIRLFTIPNVITCLNLFSGCLSIVAAFNGDFLWAFLLIIIAGVFDFFDGFVARLLKSYSEIGKELDSLADMVSFGVAPSVILLSLLEFYSGAGIERYLVFIVAAFSALRLAKFNLDTRQSTEFIGLPTPANAILIASATYIASLGEFGVLNTVVDSVWGVIMFAIALSLLLTSEIHMFSFKFKSFAFAENKLKYLFVIYTVIVLIVLKIYAVPIVILSYIILSIVRNLIKREV